MVTYDLIEKPKFDPSKPYTPGPTTKPPFDPSKPYTEGPVREAEGVLPQVLNESAGLEGRFAVKNFGGTLEDQLKYLRE